MELSNLIKRQRAAVGLSQRALAKAAGVSPSAVAQWEGGDTRPALANLTLIARALDMDLEAFFALPGSPYKGELVEKPDELAALAIWRSIDPGDQWKALGMLRAFVAPPTLRRERHDVA